MPLIHDFLTKKDIVIKASFSNKGTLSAVVGTRKNNSKSLSKDLGNNFKNHIATSVRVVLLNSVRCITLRNKSKDCSISLPE